MFVVLTAINNPMLRQLSAVRVCPSLYGDVVQREHSSFVEKECHVCVVSSNLKTVHAADRGSIPFIVFLASVSGYGLTSET